MIIVIVYFIHNQSNKVGFSFLLKIENLHFHAVLSDVQDRKKNNNKNVVFRRLATLRSHRRARQRAISLMMKKMKRRRRITRMNRCLRDGKKNRMKDRRKRKRMKMRWRLSRATTIRRMEKLRRTTVMMKKGKSDEEGST